MQGLARAVIVLLVAMALPCAAEPGPSWAFAADTRREELLTSPSAARRFVEAYVDAEAAFFAATRDPKSGLTFDGWDLNPSSGEPEKPRRFSAASKECLDLGLLVKALRGDPLIARLVSPADPKQAPAVARIILERKIRSYHAYRRAYPGFAGYLTWFSSEAEARPVGGWEKAFPTLDLGEMIWALMLTEWALRQEGHDELAMAYASFNSSLLDNARRALFDEAQGGVRGRVEVADPSSPASTFRGDKLTTGEHGVHEGQMILLFMSVYGGLTTEESDRVWQGVQMRRVEHPAGTTWQGFWGSPHEEWAYLFLPYRDLPEYRQLFRIRQKIRCQNAAQRGYPGFAASAHHPLGKGYMSACGIEGVGSQPLEHQDTYTPYGAFPLLLEFAGQESANVGLIWLHNMLLGPRMQGPFGAAESGDNAGTGVAPVKTIDASFTTLLALSGGLEKETAQMLRAHGKYDQFLTLMRREYQEAFAGEALREPVEFALPTGPAGRP